jgi:anti-sigma B factor antagonist
MNRPGPTPLAVSEHELDGDVLLVELGGELDLATADQLRDVFAAAEKAGYARVVVDLSEVSAVDSTGLAVLVAVHQHLVRSRGELVIVVGNESIASKIKITGLHQLFTLSTSLEEALSPGYKDRAPGHA